MRLPRQSRIVSSLNEARSTLGGSIGVVVAKGVGGCTQVMSVLFFLLGLRHLNSN